MVRKPHDFLILALALLLILGLRSLGYAMDVTLAWDANSETDLAGYKVYYGTIAGGPYSGSGSSEGASPIIVPLSSLTNPSSPEFSVHGLADGTYFLVATAYNSAGLESGYSNEVSAQASTTPPTTPPTNGAPTLSSFEVNGISGSTTIYTDDSNGHVSVRIVASDDGLVSQYLILDGNSNANSGTFSAIPGGPRQNPIFTVSDFVLNNSDGNHTLYAWVKDDQGLVSATAAKMNIILDRVAPTVLGFPVINFTDSSITIMYSESSIQNAALASSYSLNNGLLLSGNGVDTSGTGKVFKLPLNPATLQSYTIYTLQIGSAVTDASGNAVSSRAVKVNDDDNDGMADDWEIKWFGSISAKDGTVDSDGDGLTDLREYNLARSNPAWGSNGLALSPLSQDSDDDGIPDQYEVSFGLNPVSSSDRDTDLDGDGWSNFREYIYGFAANDPNSHPQASIDIIEVLPLDNAGVPPDTSRIPNNTAASVRVESTNGIDLSNVQAVSLTINDGESTYTRSANDNNANGQALVHLVPLANDGGVTLSLWVVYCRANETTISNAYPYGATVEVTVQATDVKGFSLEPAFFSFRIESEEAARWAEENAPATVVSNDTPMVGKKTVTVQGGTLDGASIIYDNSLAQELGFEPGFGPIEEVPQAPGLGVPLNLLPPAVFPNPVTLTIPCPGYKDVSDVSVYYYDGREWWLACDAAGNVTPEGVGWMVRGSRVNHNEDQNSPAYVQIQVYHFSAAAATEAPDASTPEGNNRSVAVAGSSSGSSSGGCFISALWD